MPKPPNMYYDNKNIKFAGTSNLHATNFHPILVGFSPSSPICQNKGVKYTRSIHTTTFMLVLLSIIAV